MLFTCKKKLHCVRLLVGFKWNEQKKFKLVLLAWKIAVHLNFRTFPEIRQRITTGYKESV